MRQSTATRQIFWAVVIAYTLCDSSEFSVFNGFVPADFDPQFVEAVDLQDAIALCQGNCRTFSRSWAPLLILFSFFFKKKVIVCLQARQRARRRCCGHVFLWLLGLVRLSG